MDSDSGICSTWFKSNFVMSHGPIAIAILAWQNSIVFHSLDKMTSYFIHIMPVNVVIIFFIILKVFAAPDLLPAAVGRDPRLCPGDRPQPEPGHRDPHSDGALFSLAAGLPLHPAHHHRQGPGARDLPQISDTGAVLP